MPEFIPSNTPPPLPTSTKNVDVQGTVVRFFNFEPGDFRVKSDHVAYIERIYVEHIINQIDALGFADKVLTIHPVGFASATGTNARNTSLSRQRAQAIGEAFKRVFDIKKSRSKLARSMTVVIAPIAKGDSRARGKLQPGKNVPEVVLERQSNADRAVWLNMQARHIVVEEDKEVLCRQILNVKITVVKGTIETWIDSYKKRGGLQFALGTILDLAIKTFVDAVSKFLKSVAETALKNAEMAAPEIFIIFKGVEFMIPSDIAEQFEFKNSRGRSAVYNYTGTKHRVELGFIEVFCQVLSVARWATKLPKALQDLDDLAEKGAPKLNLTHEAIDSIKKAIDMGKKVVSTAQQLWDFATAKQSPVRGVLGDALVDSLVSAVAAAKSQVIPVEDESTPWSNVSFTKNGVMEIDSFGGVARTLVWERVAGQTHIELEFAAEKNIPELGFQGQVLLFRKWRMSLQLVAFQTSTGNLSRTIG